MSESTISVLTGIILVLVAIAVVFLFVFGIKDRFNSATDTGICKASVIKSSLKSTIDIKESDIFVMCPSKSLGVLEEQEYAFAKLILDESQNCWNKFGKGKLNPVVGGLVDQEVGCFSCASFKIKENVNNVSALLNTYLDVGEYDLDDAFLKSSEENVYLVNEYDESKGFKVPKDFSLKSGEWYSLINTFIVDRNWVGWTVGYINTYDTYSKLMIIKNSDVKNVCYMVENV